MSWFKRNAGAIEAAAAVVTALVAVAALIGIKLQLDAAERVQRGQSARDAFRAHLVLSIDHPDFAQPQDACALLESPQAPAYGAFVEHLLYSAELMLSLDRAWSAVFVGQLQPHAAYVCRWADVGDYEAPLADVLAQFRATHCPAVPTCGG